MIAKSSWWMQTGFSLQASMSSNHLRAQKTKSAWRGVLFGKRLIGIRRGRSWRWQDLRLSCRTPIGNVCNRGTWRGGSAWGHGRSDTFWWPGFDGVSSGVVVFRRGRSGAWCWNLIKFCLRCWGGIHGLCTRRDHCGFGSHNSWDHPTRIPQWNHRDPIHW